jgi:hypothetical protein
MIRKKYVFIALLITSIGQLSACNNFSIYNHSSLKAKNQKKKPVVSIDLGTLTKTPHDSISR